MGGSMFNLGYFDSSLSIKPIKDDISAKVSKFGASFAMSSFNGDPIFLGGNLAITDIKGNPIKNYEKNYIPDLSVGLQTGDNSWNTLGFLYADTNLFWKTGPYSFKKQTMRGFCYAKNCFDSILHYPFGLYQTEIKRDTNNMPYISEKMQTKYFNLPINKMDFFDVKRNKDYSYNLLGKRTKNPYKNYDNNSVGIYNFSYQKNKLVILDSFIFNAYDYLPDSMRLKTALTNYYISIWSLNLSRNRDKIFATISISFPDDYFNYGYTKEMIFEIDVNPSSGKFISLPKIIFQTTRLISEIHLLPTVLPSYIGFSNPSSNDAFSPNDSIYYLNYGEQKFEKGLTKEITAKVLAWRFREEPLANAKPIFSKTEFNKENASFGLSLANINPYGGLTFIYQDQSNPSSYSNKFYNYKNANTVNSSLNIQTFSSSQYGLGDFYSALLHNYDYIRVKKDNIIYKDCGAYAKLNNISDVSNGISNFKWYISKNSKWTEWDSFATKDLPTQFFKKSGKYLFKLHGTSYKGSGYAEWYIDTIIINIPPKPIANFYAKDTIVCRYTGLRFFNYSHAKDTLKNDYLWSFGDGNTSTAKNPTHTYTNAGIFTVSLFYRNGYCDSTLVKNQYIRVVDAPKPGFSVLHKQGCAPFIAQFTDTTILNVQQKDYWISDGSGWKNIPIAQPNFTHTFAKAGVYKATQRLIGFSGCVIMQDSVIFNISKGLTASDTLNLINGTILNPSTPYGNANTINFPLLWWHKLDGAVQYQIFKNGSNLSIVSDTFLQENKAYLADANYSVVGIDSCGNKSSAGRISKPMFLQATMIGNNEASLVQFSPYLQWQGNSIIYQLQKLITGNWQTVNAANSNTNYTDNQFLNFSEVQACYRVQAKESSMPTIETYSNEICIPYIPTIYVPNAFTPNDDGVNDVFDVTGFGIQNYNITIYNRWGEQVFAGANKQAWNGSNAADGVYVARIEFVTNKGIKLNQRVTVTLLK